MTKSKILFSTLAAITASLASGTSVWAADTVLLGASGKTFTSSAVACETNPATGSQEPVVDAGLFNPKKETKATVKLNGSSVSIVTTELPATKVWLADGSNTVIVALSK